MRLGVCCGQAGDLVRMMRSVGEPITLAEAQDMIREGDKDRDGKISLITPIFSVFSRFFPVFPWTSGRARWIPGVQTVKMGERWGKVGKRCVKNGITVRDSPDEKTALMRRQP